MTFRDIDTTALSAEALRRRVALLREAHRKAVRVASARHVSYIRAADTRDHIYSLLHKAMGDADMRRADPPRVTNNRVRRGGAEKRRIARRYRDLVATGDRGDAKRYAESTGVAWRTVQRWASQLL